MLGLKFSFLSLVSQLCLTLCDPMDCSAPGSSVHRIFPGKSTGVGCHFLFQLGLKPPVYFLFLSFPDSGLIVLKSVSFWYLCRRHMTKPPLLGLPSVKESACQVGEPSSIPGLGRFPGKGNGKPLQYSCLGNPVDGGAWWTAVHGVTKIWTWLSDWTAAPAIISKWAYIFCKCTLACFLSW